MSASFSYSTSNTKEAAAFASCGFVVSLDISDNVVNDDVKGKTLMQWIIGDTNPVQPGLRLQPLLKAWQAGNLPQDHFLKIRWRACLNFEALTDAQRTGQRLRLRALSGDRYFEFIPGDELPSLKASQEVMHLSDLNLSAALSVIGVPILEIFGQPGSRTYVLPRYGHPRIIGEAWQTEDAAQLVTRQPGSFDLVIEQTSPDHPLVHAYNALHVWAQLRVMLAKERKRLVCQWPRHTQRRAVISEAASPRVVDRLRRHLKLPKGV